jgi:hypothetical protein
MPVFEGETYNDDRIYVLTVSEVTVHCPGKAARSAGLSPPGAMSGGFRRSGKTISRPARRPRPTIRPEPRS